MSSAYACRCRSPCTGGRAQSEALIAATQGQWTGELQYRDYQSNRWVGLPVQVDIVAQPDGVTTVRTARYDDGPKTGSVTITAVSGGDSAHWTIVTTEKRIDGNGLAQVRETTTRDGDHLTTSKEVNPEGDGVDSWLPRNRTVLTRVPVASSAR